MSSVTWVDGRLVDGQGPAIPASDHGLLLGDGVYTTVAVRDGVAIALTRHIARLESSLQAMGIASPGHDEIASAVAQTLAAGHHGAVRLRVTVTSGDGPAGLRRGSTPRVIVWAGPAVEHGPCDAVRGPWARNERSAVAGIKTTSYAQNVVMAAWARERGASECLIANTRGELCEGVGSNVFVELGGELLTPALDTGCLPGIARSLILEWGKAEGAPVREAHDGELPFDVLERVLAGDAYAAVSSSTRGLAALASLDGVSLQPGPLVTQVAVMLAERIARDPDPLPV